MFGKDLEGNQSNSIREGFYSYLKLLEFENMDWRVKTVMLLSVRRKIANVTHCASRNISVTQCVRNTGLSSKILLYFEVGKWDVPRMTFFGHLSFFYI